MVYDIGLQRYLEQKIRVCCKDSIPLPQILIGELGRTTGISQLGSNMFLRTFSFKASCLLTCQKRQSLKTTCIFISCDTIIPVFLGHFLLFKHLQSLVSQKTDIPRFRERREGLNSPSVFRQPRSKTNPSYPRSKPTRPTLGVNKPILPKLASSCFGISIHFVKELKICVKL